MSESREVIAQATLVYEKFQTEALARVEFIRMTEWVASGRPPAAETLRAQGLTAVGSDNVDDLRLARQAVIRDWGFSLPCAEAVEALSRHGPWIEIGAGTGYWSAMLRAGGLDVVATDLVQSGANPYRSIVGRHCPVAGLDAVAAVRAYPERDVFCSWPSEGEDWPADAARAMANGRILALIADDRRGVIGSVALYDLLDDEFEVVERVTLPQWPRERDHLTLYRRS
jgi:hypothetical protein